MSELGNLKELGPFGGSDAKTINAVYSAETSATTGNVSAPTGGTLIEDHFASGVDAYCSTVTTGFAPDQEIATESDGTPVVVTSFVAATGAFVLSGLPSPVPAAIVFAASGTLVGLDISDALEAYDLDGASVLDGYREVATAITITAGAASSDHPGLPNIVTMALIANTVWTITNPVAYKALTVEIAQTAGPWTFDVVCNSLTLAITINGVSGEPKEIVELWSDGTDMWASNGDGTWSKGV